MKSEPGAGRRSKRDLMVEQLRHFSARGPNRRDRIGMTVFLPFSRPTAALAPFILVSAPLQSDAAACTNRGRLSELRTDGARRLVRRLNQFGISHRYEEFPDNHTSVDYRTDESLPFSRLRGEGIASLSRACSAKVRLAKDPYAEGAPGRLGARWP